MANATSKIASLPSQRQQMETRFVELITGEDTEFHLATEDMYYIKSGDIFTDFPVRLANGRQFLFTVDPESLQATRSALKPNDKAHCEMDAATKDGEIIKVRLKYLKGAQTEK